MACQSNFAYIDPMVETFEDEVEELFFDQLVADQVYHDFAAFKRLGSRFWKPNNGVDGTLFRLPLRLEASEISSVTYETSRIDALLRRFCAEAHSTLVFLRRVQSIKVFVIEEGCEDMEEIYSANLSDASRAYGDQKTVFLQNIEKLAEIRDFQTLRGLDHYLQIRIKEEDENRVFTYAVSEQYGYDGNEPGFKALLNDQELSYVPLVAVAYPIRDHDSSADNRTADPGGHVFCTLPLPMLQEKGMTGMPGKLIVFNSLSV